MNVATAIVGAVDSVIANDEKWPRLRTLYPRIKWLYLDAYRQQPDSASP